MEYYGLLNNICKRFSHDTMAWSKVLFDDLHSPCHINLINLGSTLGRVYLSSSLFCPARRCIVSSHTPVTSHSKVHLYLWWTRKTASSKNNIVVSINNKRRHRQMNQNSMLLSMFMQILAALCSTWHDCQILTIKGKLMWMHWTNC